MNPLSDKTIDRFVRFGSPVAVIGALLFFATQGPPPKPVPANERVYGCYVAEGAPAIRLGIDGMVVEGTVFGTIPFRIERSKLGYSIETNRPLALDDSGGRPRLIVENRAGGVYLRFFRYDGARTYGVYEIDGPTPFQIIGDRSHLNYLPTTAARCRW